MTSYCLAFYVGNRGINGLTDPPYNGHDFRVLFQATPKPTAPPKEQPQFPYERIQSLEPHLAPPRPQIENHRAKIIAGGQSAYSTAAKTEPKTRRCLVRRAQASNARRDGCLDAALTGWSIGEFNWRPFQPAQPDMPPILGLTPFPATLDHPSEKRHGSLP
jgi:hypothetical protein